MTNRIVVESKLEMIRVAVLEDGELAEYYVERDGRCCMVGNIYIGRVQNVLPGMQAAFVNIGTEKNAFLYLGEELTGHGEFALDGNTKNARRIKIQPGQEIMVQVIKESEGQKGPRVTTHITVPGSMVVLAVDTQYIGISRRIEDETERERLFAIARQVCPVGMGLILRTAAVGMSEEDLVEEVRILDAEWTAISRKASHLAPPKCIHREDTLLLRSVRDLFSCHTQEMLIDDERLYHDAREQIELRRPELIDRVKLYRGDLPLFEALQLEDKTEKAIARKVWLKSGGYLIFDTTEALTVIDVNTGKFVGKKDLQDTVFRVNIEAAREIARQLRLRDVGGIIVIDFIDMEDFAQREELVDTLKGALKGDRNKTNVVGLTGLGLVEMTRKKTRISLSKALQRPCSYCRGSGRVYTPDYDARRALREIARKRLSGDEQAYELEAAQEMIDAFERLGGAPGVRSHAAFSLPDEHFVFRPLFKDCSFP